MAMDTLLVFAASYESVDDAVADYEAVRDIWKETTVGDTYDAAVVTHQEDGKVKIVKHLEEPTIQGAAIGLGVGLAVGALVAVFPAVAIGAGLVAGGAGGAGLGALAGHAAAGISRSSESPHERLRRVRRDRVGNLRRTDPADLGPHLPGADAHRPRIPTPQPTESPTARLHGLEGRISHRSDGLEVAIEPNGSERAQCWPARGFS